MERLLPEIIYVSLGKIVINSIMRNMSTPIQYILSLNQFVNLHF